MQIVLYIAKRSPYTGPMKWPIAAAAVMALTGCSVLEPATPLQQAAAHDDVAALAALLNKAGDPNEIGAHGITPLATAARVGALNSIRFLAARGADLNRGSGVNGWTPIMHAIHKHQLASIRALLDAGADINARGESRTTALLLASQSGYREAVKFLQSRGAAHL